jgi:pyruvate formate lyase activating enzyme
VVTLVVPGFNDSDAELAAIAEFLASVSVDIPWHVTAFHPDYRMTDRDATTAQTLVRAVASGQAAGLRYVYAGNVPGRLAKYENTYCPSCHAAVVERAGYHILANHLEDGCCAHCGTRIPGRWGSTRQRGRGIRDRAPRSVAV